MYTHNEIDPHFDGVEQLARMPHDDMNEKFIKPSKKLYNYYKVGSFYMEYNIYKVGIIKKNLELYRYIGEE